MLGCCVEADAMVKWLKEEKETMLLRPSIKKKEALKLFVYPNS
jgi:hypothetical protein